MAARSWALAALKGADDGVLTLRCPRCAGSSDAAVGDDVARAAGGTCWLCNGTVAPPQPARRDAGHASAPGLSFAAAGQELAWLLLPTDDEVARVDEARRADPATDRERFALAQGRTVACRFCSAGPGAACDHPANRAAVVDLALRALEELPPEPFPRDGASW